MDLQYGSKSPDDSYMLNILVRMTTWYITLEQHSFCQLLLQKNKQKNKKTLTLRKIPQNPEMVLPGYFKQ